jgi:hypothetical protein
MITKVEAFKLVEKQLRKIQSEENFRIDEHNTQKHDWGWVIYYNSERYLETNDIQFALIGNGPFLVHKETGKIESVSSSGQVEDHIDSWLKIDDE